MAQQRSSTSPSWLKNIITFAPLLLLLIMGIHSFVGVNAEITSSGLAEQSIDRRLDAEVDSNSNTSTEAPPPKAPAKEGKSKKKISKKRADPAPEPAEVDLPTVIPRGIPEVQESVVEERIGEDENATVAVQKPRRGFFEWLRRIFRWKKASEAQTTDDAKPNAPRMGFISRLFRRKQKVVPNDDAATTA